LQNSRGSKGKAMSGGGKTEGGGNQKPPLNHGWMGLSEIVTLFSNNLTQHYQIFDALRRIGGDRTTAAKK
jgi:hypothetical protein